MLRPLFAIAIATSAIAQGPAVVPPLVEQPAPFSVWLDFAALAAPGAEAPAMPIWLESFQSDDIPATATEPPQTNYRARLRRMPGLHREVLLKVYFDDLPEMGPVVSLWSETGRERYRSGPLGEGLGLPTSASVVLPLEGVDYIDVTVPGDGSSVRGAMIASLREATVRETLDFQATAEVTHPFGSLPADVPAAEDTRLFGRVKALLEAPAYRLGGGEATTATYSIELAAQPIAGLLTVEILNADFTAPPTLTINDEPPAPLQVAWPDLADPAFRGEARGGHPGMRLQYTGWLTAQVAIPGSALKAGLNTLTIALSEGSGAVAVRHVGLQLKHPWKHFDYILSPNQP